MLVRAAARRRREAALATSMEAPKGKRQSVGGLRRKASMGPGGVGLLLSTTAGSTRKSSSVAASRKTSGVPVDALTDKPPVPPLVRCLRIPLPQPTHGPTRPHACVHALLFPTTLCILPGKKHPSRRWDCMQAQANGRSGKLVNESLPAAARSRWSQASWQAYAFNDGLLLRNKCCKSEPLLPSMSGAC